MPKAFRQQPVTIPPVERMIHVIRGQKVMLDADLARLYEVPTKRLNEAVRRHASRFPDDFMFRLTKEEATLLRSQFATASKRNIQYQPFAFTESGIAMLSSVLNSERAVQMNIAIMRAFIRMRELVAHHKDLADRVEKLERNRERADSIIEVIIDDIDRITRDVDRIKNPPVGTKKKIGYIWGND